MLQLKAFLDADALSIKQASYEKIQLTSLQIQFYVVVY